MNTIYELVNTVFRAESLVAKEIQLELLQKKILNTLENKEDEKLQEALELAHLNNMQIYNLLEQSVINTINSMNYIDYENVNDFRSDIFLIPVTSHSKYNHTKFLSLNWMETFLYDLLLKYELIPSTSKLILSPVFINKEISQKMTYGSWYELHIKTLKNAPKRGVRTIFSQDYFIKSTPHTPSLNFLFGSVVQSTENIECIKPKFLSDDYYINEDKENFLKEFNEKLSERLPQSNTNFFMPKNLMVALTEGYYEFQNIIISDFVKKYTGKSDISYGVITLDLPEAFVLMAWNEKENKIFKLNFNSF